MEVFHNGEWGTVANEYFGTNGARVVCRSLGYGGAAASVWYSGFGPGTGNIAFGDIGCNGDEASIFDCSTYEPDSSDFHYEDAGVRCQGKDVDLNRYQFSAIIPSHFLCPTLLD